MSPDFQLLFERCPSACLVLEPDLRIVAVSDAYLRATQTERAQLVGRGLFEIFPQGAVDPASRGDELRTSVERAFATRLPDIMGVQRHDVLLPTAQGGGVEVRYVSPRNTPVLGAGGEVCYLIHEFADVTACVSGRGPGDELSPVCDSPPTAGGLGLALLGEPSAVPARTRAPSRAADPLEEEWLPHAEADALEDERRRKNEFLAMLAHELRNPLAALSTAAQLMEGARDVHHLERLRRTIGRQVSTLARLLDELLDASRITRGRITLQVARVDLGDVLRTVLQALEPQITAAGQQLVVQIPAAPVEVMGDPARLEQVFANLVHNATRYTDVGGRISVQLDCDADGTAKVDVQDSGMGIPPKLLPQLFELFMQSERGLDRSKGGLGIGLTLVHRLVGLHGGTVEAASEGPGKGSTFSVRLSPAPPRAQEGAAGEAEATHSDEPGGGAHIVLVEDNEDARELLKELLESWGHEVEVAADGASGLELVRAAQPDVAIIDIGLPVLDGFEVGGQVRRSPGGSDVRLIALTGYSDLETKTRCEQAGFDWHLTKPVDPDELARLLNEVSSGPTR